MNQLINTIKQNGKIAVNARDLYRFLEIRTPFRKWIYRNIHNYGFLLNEDYMLPDKNVRRQVGYNKKLNVILTLDTAKEIAMVQRNYKGRQARRYFINIQKAYRDQFMNMNNNPVVKRLTNFVKTLAKSHNRLADDFSDLVKKHNSLLNSTKSAVNHRRYIPNITSMTTIGKDYNKTAHEMNLLLNKLHVIHKDGSTWALYPEFRRRNLVKYQDLVHNNGEIQKAIYWTKTEGKKFIHNILGSYGIFPESD